MKNLKNLREIDFESMSVRQKLGFVNLALYPNNCSLENEEFIFDQIKNRSLGAIWIQCGNNKEEMKTVSERIAKVLLAADYPILIFTDAESGIGEYKIGHHNPLGCTNSEESAYAFGKAVGIEAKKLGYTAVCNPILDIETNGSSRSLGSDKIRVAKLAAAEARGMRDAGILTVAKHYPGGNIGKSTDTHMIEGVCSRTEEELLLEDLYPYTELIKNGLLDGIMSSHYLLSEIDGEFPVSLSTPAKAVIRNQGFDGFILTDALCMMGVIAKHGRVKPMGLAIESGGDFAMMYDSALIFNQNSVYECYEKGLLSDTALDAAVKRILKAQSKSLALDKAKCEKLTANEESLAKNIERNAVFEKRDSGVGAALSPDGKYFFAVMADNSLEFNQGGVEVDTFSGHWYNPQKIIKSLAEAFPNSKIESFYQFPNQRQCWNILNKSIDCDEIIFITYSEFLAYTGEERFTHRVVSVFDALQYTGRVSTLLHFGNPVIIEELPHIPRIILAGASDKGIEAGLEVLLGKLSAKGILTYDVNFK